MPIVLTRLFLSLQAQLKLADTLRKMAEQGRDLEGMDVDLDELRHNLNKLKKGRFGAFLGDFDFQVRYWQLARASGNLKIFRGFFRFFAGFGRLDQQQEEGQGRHHIFL